MNGFKSQGFIVSLHAKSIVKGIVILIFSFILIFSVIGAITSLKPALRISSASVSNIAINVPSETLMHVLGFENHYFSQGVPENNNTPSLLSVIFRSATNINLDDPRSLLGRELPGFSIFDGKIFIAGEGTNYTNMPIESPPPLDVLLGEREAAAQNIEQAEKPNDQEPISPPTMNTGDKKVVFIYHTHSWESFFPHLKDVNTKDVNNAVHSTVNVTKVGEMLQEELEARGIGADADTRNMHKYRNEKGYKYSQNYQLSGEIMASAMTNNKDLSYFIDIHRDARRKEDTTKIINGQSFAKIAFVVGKDNPQFEKNLAVASELFELFEKKYPGLVRAVLHQGGKGNNGVYNQDKSEKAMLIEFGGVDNNFEELRRTAAAVADVFAEYYWQAEKVNANSETNKE